MLLFRKPLHFWNFIHYFQQTATLSIWWHRPCWCFLGISSACPWGCSFAAIGVHRNGTIFNFVEWRCLQNTIHRNIERYENLNLVSPQTSYCYKCATQSWTFDCLFISYAIGPLYICLWPWAGLVADFMKTTFRKIYAVIVLTYHCKRTRQERMCWHVHTSTCTMHLHAHLLFHTKSQTKL